MPFGEIAPVTERNTSLPLGIGLKRYDEEIKSAGGLTLEILPFRSDAPVGLPNRPTAGSEPILSLVAVNIVPIYQVKL